MKTHMIKNDVGPFIMMIKMLFEGRFKDPTTDKPLAIHRDLSFALSKNKPKLVSTAEAINEAIKNDKEYQAFDEPRIKLNEKYARKDSRGRAMQLPDGNYDIVDWISFSKEMNPLIEEHKEAIEAHEKWMKETVEIELHAIKYELIPEYAPGSVVDMLRYIVDDGTNIKPKKAKNVPDKDETEEKDVN